LKPEEFKNAGVSFLWCGRKALLKKKKKKKKNDGITLIV